MLELHRIPHGKTSPPTDARRRPVVFIQDALFFTSFIWVMTGPGRALAFLLADAGYDVWMGNSRGNIYSRCHVDKNVTDAEYWDFSVHERAVYDLSASIDVVLNVTQQSDLVFIGISRGPMTLFILTSLMPKYNANIRVAICICPIVLLSPPQSAFIKLAAYNTQIVQIISRLLDVYEWAPASALMDLVDPTNCKRGSFSARRQCELIIKLIVNDSTRLLNKRTIDYMKEVKAHGQSIKEMVHYGQNIVTRKFRQFDYGAAGNTKRYGSATPPTYDLSRVTLPVAIFVGDRDMLTTPQTIGWLTSRLPNMIGEFHVAKYNHVDFFEADDAKTLVYDKIFSIMTQYESD